MIAGRTTEKHMMKSVILGMMLASGLFSVSLADEMPQTPSPMTEETPAPSAQSESSGSATEISTPRKCVGFGVLAFLIGWMIWRNGNHTKVQKKEAEETTPEGAETEKDVLPK